MSRYIRVFLPCFLAVKKMKLSREENWINYPRALKNPVLPREEYILSTFLINILRARVLLRKISKQINDSCQVKCLTR